MTASKALAFFLTVLSTNLITALNDVSSTLNKGQNCEYLANKISSQIVAFYNGKLLTNISVIPHLDTITVRCSNVQNLKFFGKQKFQCINGTFDGPLPECRGLLPNNDQTAPPLWLRTYPGEHLQVTEEGMVIIPRKSSISITCWYTKSQPDIKINSDIQPSYQGIKPYGTIVGWTAVFENVSQSTTLNYSCGSSKSSQELTQNLIIKIADTCTLNESFIESLGLSIEPSTRRYVYSENDEIVLLCSDQSKQYFPSMTCMQGGEWYLAPEIPCAVISNVEIKKITPTEVLKTCSCMDLTTNLSSPVEARCAGPTKSGAKVELQCIHDLQNLTQPAYAECQNGVWIIEAPACNDDKMNSCIYSEKIFPSTVTGFHQGRILAYNSQIPHLGNITIRCRHVVNMKFVGKQHMQCSNGTFDGPIPKCLSLLPKTRYIGPTTLFKTSEPTPRINEDGTIIIPRNSSLSLTCLYLKKRPDINISTDVKPNSQRESIIGGLVGWEMEFDNILEISTLNFSCGIPGKNLEENYTQHIKIHIADTCYLREDRIKAFGLLVQPETRRYVFKESDQVKLVCGSGVKRYFPSMVCDKGGRWVLSPEIDCPNN